MLAPTVMATSSLWRLAAVTSLCSACVGDPELARAPRAPVVNACPLGVAFTRMSVVDTSAGVDVVFTTRDDHVAELRRRVRDQAERHGPGARAGAGHDGRHGLRHEHGMRLWELPPSDVAVADVERGARLSLSPAGATDHDELRTRVIRRVAHLEAQGCRD